MPLNAVFENATDISAILRAISNEKRMLIICRLVQREYTPTELATSVGLSTASLSQHLNILKSFDLISFRGEAQQRYYRCLSPLVLDLFKHIGTTILQPDAPGDYIKKAALKVED